MLTDDAPLSELQQEVRKEIERLNGEIKRLSSNDAKREGELMEIRRMIESRYRP